MPSAAAITILEFGQLLHAEAQLPVAKRDPQRIALAEQKFIERLSADDNPLLKPALSFHISKPIEPLVLRILSLVAYLQLATNFRTAVSDIAVATAEDVPSRILEARQTITQLLYLKRLILQVNTDDQVELGRPMLALLQGGSTKLPLTLTACDLHREWRKNDDSSAKRKAQESVATLPTAKQLTAKISEKVIGLDAEVRTFACRLVLHQRRAALLRAGQDPGTGNGVLLFMGPSGCGKTWLAETAGKICGLPFGSISATDLTCEGYQGLSVDDAIKQVIESAKHDLESARYGICLIDEWDKKRAAGAEYGSRDVAGAAVQQGVLRMIEGCDFQVGGRRGGFEMQYTISTRGMFYVFAGAFVGLNELLHKRSAHGIGFGGRADGAGSQYLYDALVDYGMLPEFCNRLNGVLVFPAPTVEQLVQIATRSIIPSYRTLLASSGVNLQVSTDGVQRMAEAARETGTFARGIKSIVTRLVEDIVFEEPQGLINFSVAEVDAAIKGAGLAAVATE